MFINVSGFSIPKLILVFLPFVTCFFFGLRQFLKGEAQRAELNRMMSYTTRSVEEKSVSKIILQEEEELSFIEKQNAKLNLLGIEYKFETVLGFAAVLFFLGCFLSLVLFKTGILLMIYLGCLSAASAFIYTNGLLKKKKRAFTLEFLEKMRDIATFLSVGKSLNNAILEALQSDNISRVMFRELDQVRRDIYIGKKTSEAFMEMYRRLQIEDIRMYAETLAVFEETGGNLITVMKANDKFATGKLELRNEQDIFLKQQKTSQKIIIGVPLSMLIFFFVFNPSFFGDFYKTLVGEVLAIICITVLVVGVMLSNYMAQIHE